MKGIRSEVYYGVFFQAEDGIRDLVRSRGLGDVYKRQPQEFLGLADLLRWVEAGGAWPKITSEHPAYFYTLSLIHI